MTIVYLVSPVAHDATFASSLFSLSSSSRSLVMRSMESVAHSFGYTLYYFTLA